MIGRETATRIAAAVNAIRPDWPIASLVTLIGQHHQHRMPSDVAAAFAWIAMDPDTNTPARANGPGPWWPAGVAQTAHPQPPRVREGELRPDAPVSDERRAELLAALRARLKDPT